MALPKRRHSATRRDKRRNSKHLKCIMLEKCKSTGVSHKPHEGYLYRGSLYYRGRLLFEDKEVENKKVK